VTAAKRQARTMDPVQSLARRPILSFVADPATAPVQETIELAKVRSTEASSAERREVEGGNHGVVRLRRYLGGCTSRAKNM